VRILARLALAALVLVAAALAALAIALPRYVKSDAVRAKLEAAAEQGLGREVRYADLHLGFLPPSLVVEEPRVAGPTPQAPPAVEAEQIALHLALATLLERKLVIDSLVVDGAKLRLVRTKDGVELPVSPEPREPREVRAEGEVRPEEDEGFSFGVREAHLRGAKLLFDDRALSPPVAWKLSGVDIRLRGISRDQPFDVEVEVEMEGGGRLSGRGSAGLDARIDLEFALDTFPVDPIASYVESATQVAGTLSGTLSARGRAGDPDPLGFDLVLQDGDIRFDEVTLRGRVAIKGEISGGLGASTGRFEADATEAELRLGAVFVKPPGRPATIKGHLVTRPDGRLGVDDVQVNVGNVEAHGKLDLGDRMRLLVSAASFDLSGVHALFIPLADYALSGPVSVSEVEVLTKPLELRGEVHLEGVTARVPDVAEFEMRGSLVGEGDVIRTRDLTLTAGGEVIPVEGELRGLDRSGSYRLRVQTEQADTNRIVSAFSANDDKLHGPLDLLADLNGSFDGSRSFAEALAGHVRFEIAPGRLRGISILEATFRRFDQTGALGFLKVLKLPGRQAPVAPGLKRYYGEHFDSLEGTLEIRGGQAHTPDFQLVTPTYQFALRGLIRLADLGLDSEGELVLGEELTGSIAGLVGLPKMPLVQKVVIPIPKLGGTLTDPKPQPDFRFLLRAIAGNLPGSGALKKLREAVRR
jgi:hypothetical protein